MKCRIYLPESLGLAVLYTSSLMMYFTLSIVANALAELYTASVVTDDIQGSIDAESTVSST